MNVAPLRIAVLISGTGSNLKTLIDAREAGQLNIDIVLVISNRGSAPGLQHARNAGIETVVIQDPGRQARDRAIGRALEKAGADLVVLAGFMSILGPELAGRFKGRMINLHPSLLPRYPGLHTYRRALEAGDDEHGASIHFVTAALDAGPVISQVRIPVKDSDDEASLSTRLGPREHRLLVATVELFAERRVEMHSGSVLFNGQVRERPLLLNDENQFD